MIRVKNLTINIENRNLFEKVSFILHKGDRVGIVGPNGAGKSTLLKAIMKEVEIDGGTITIEKERIGYLPQEVFQETKDLSGGQKTRRALEQILGRKPTMLLLDEPTNHLDSKAVEWLKETLKEFRGGILIVSHDRRLLDSVTKKILEIDPVNGSFNEYDGNYSEYIIERQKRIEQEGLKYQHQQKEKKRLENWLTLKRQEASVYADASKGKQIRAKEKYLQREIYDKEISKPNQFKKIRGATLEGEVSNSKLILRATSVSKSFNEKKILSNVSFEIRGKERVLLSGDNGSGKTTLLKILVSELEQDSGEATLGTEVSIGYFSQEHEYLDQNKTVLEEFLSTPHITSENPRGVLGSFLFSNEDVFKKVSSLSLGERVRLIFAKLTNQKNELLILDEPTNHLDTQSREIIEMALEEYQGAILMVSHDKYFIEKIKSDRLLEIKKGLLRERKMFL